MEQKTQIATVVEDEPEVREHLAELINAQPDFACQWTYKSPDDAIAFLPHKDVQIIIMDIELKSHKDGIQLSSGPMYCASAQRATTGRCKAS